MKLLWAALALIAFSVPAIACAEHGKIIDLDDAYAYATTASQTTAAVFIEIENEGPADKLIAASAPIATAAELHTMTNENGVMKMRQVAAYDIPADTTLELSPTGNHIMLVGVKEPLAVGGTFPLTLTFEKKGEKTTNVKIIAPGTQQETPSDNAGHEHHH